jgi:glycosyltransferase involved in cell wall biosynthesis
MPAPASEASTETILQAHPEISIVVPVYNEEENVLLLHDKLTAALGDLGLTYEILYVDDGSSDRSFALLESIAKRDSKVRVIRFRRNFGQTAAMAAGLHHAKGNVIVPLDADLQNDPADIPHLLAKMDEGFDVVSGWRLKRKDNALRRLPSHVANGLISRVTGVPLHDYGCSLKAYRASIIKDVELYGEMHRFIPAYAAMVGGRVTEIPVRHHPRVAGKSKYGMGRVFHVLLDLLVVKYLGRYGSKPIYFFGGAGIWAFGLGALLWLIAIVQKYAQPLNLNRNPLFYVGILLFLMAMQFIMLGLLAEINMRTYHESQNKPPYIIEQTCNL